MYVLHVRSSKLWFCSFSVISVTMVVVPFPLLSQKCWKLFGLFFQYSWAISGLKSWDLCFHFIAKVYFQMLSVYHVWFSVKLRQKKEEVRTILVYIIISVVIPGRMFGSFVLASSVTNTTAWHFRLYVYSWRNMPTEIPLMTISEGRWKSYVVKIRILFGSFLLLNWFYLGFLFKAEGKT